MKKILLLVHAAQKKPGHLNWVAFRDFIRQHTADDIEVEISALTRLTFVLNDDQARIYDIDQDFDIADFDLVVFRTIGQRLEEAIAVAAYCRKNNISYIDDYIPTVGNKKLSCAFVRWEHDLPVPKTVYGPLEGMIKEVETVGLPAVLKADGGKKGRDNYLVSTTEEIQRFVTALDAPRFVLQGFIPNDGDLRLVVMNDTVQLIIKRRASAGSHLNNTSQGGTAELIDVEKFPKTIRDLAVEASRLERLSISGVDLIQDRETGKYFILEVNRAPQIATGGFADLKTERYARALEDIVKGKA